VTRAPVRGNLFAVAMGIGGQITFCWYLILNFFAFNLLSHVMFRPWLFYGNVIVLATSGYPNGYIMGRVLRLFGREHDWKPVAAVSALCFPLYCVLMIFLIDFFEWSESAQEEFDFLRASATFILWCCIGIPMTYIGAAKAMEDHPSSTFEKRNTNPRTIPD